MLLSSIFTRSMVFAHLRKAQLPFVLLRVNLLETLLTIRQNSLNVAVCMIARTSYQGYFIHSLSTLYYYNAPSLATRLTGDYRDRTYTGKCGPASLDTPQSKRLRLCDYHVYRQSAQRNLSVVSALNRKGYCQFKAGRQLLCHHHRIHGRRHPRQPDNRNLGRKSYLALLPHSPFRLYTPVYPAGRTGRNYRIKFVFTAGSRSGNVIPAAFPASIQERSHAILLPSVRIVCIPSLSCFTSSGVLPCT